MRLFWQPSEIRPYAEATQQRLLNQAYVKLDVEKMAEIYRALY